MSDHPLGSAAQAAGARFADVAGIRMALDYGDPAGEYAAARHGAAIYNASDRGLIEVRAKDRAAWLHNLTTNVIKTLGVHEGNYAFAINVKGRILFDLNVLALPDAFWLDIDRRLSPKALAHFDRYTITEDVQCPDRSGDYARIALCGPKAVEIADALGVTQAKAMPALGSTPIALSHLSGLLRSSGAGILPALSPLNKGGPQGGSDSLLVRHDFAGVFGVEFYIPTAAAADFWNHLLEIGRPVGLRPAGWQAINMLRIEAGIPWYGHDIDEEVVPAETGQAERAVSYVKGCYLGQEVVERMRSRGVVANKLIGLRFATEPEVCSGRPPCRPFSQELRETGGQETELAPSASEGSEPHVRSNADRPPTRWNLQLPAILKVGESEVGRLTSVCHSPALNAWIGLGYARSSHATPGTRLTVPGDPPVEAEIVPLPFRQ